MAANSHSDYAPALVPPVDIAWVWHLHRLAPLRYAAYCQERFGTVLDPGKSAFRLQSDADVQHHDDAVFVYTRDVWACAYPGKPFFLGADCSTSGGASETSLVKPILATAERQSTFLWQVSGASFADERFLATAIERYDKFLRLMGTHGLDKHFYVPSYDVDLCWHTHMLSSSIAYHKETRFLAGEPVDHDDSVNQRQEGSKLQVSWTDTKKLWWQTYGDETAALDADGTGYRGEPPAWWFEDRNKRQVVVHEEVLAMAMCQQLVEALKGLTEAEAGQDTHERELELAIPSSVYESLISIMQEGCGAQVVPTDVPGLETSKVLVPAKISAKAVPMHRVGWSWPSLNRACRRLHTMLCI